MADFKQDDNGRYLANGLSEKDFNRLFNHIEKIQRKNRRSAKRTLTPAQLRAKKAADIAKLGEKAKGQPFTKDDLKAFEKAAREARLKYDSKRDGITYRQLVAGSREIDIKRANNKVSDGTGITRVDMSSMRGNVLHLNVKASSVSVHERHRVKIRFEEWNDNMMDPPGNSYLTAVKQACQGRVSFDCDCGRHQYWYRYIATIGRYAITPPAEFAFPKIRNPELKGVACKHVLKSMVMLQSAVWHKLLEVQMKAQASRVSFGDDRKFTKHFTENEKKEAAKNRSTQINQAKIKAEWTKYKKAVGGMAKKLKDEATAVKKVREQAKRLRVQRNQIKKQDEKLRQMRDMVRLSFNLLADSYKAMGKSRDDAINAFAAAQGVTPEQVRKVIK